MKMVLTRAEVQAEKDARQREEENFPGILMVGRGEDPRERRRKGGSDDLQIKEEGVEDAMELEVENATKAGDDLEPDIRRSRTELLDQGCWVRIKSEVFCDLEQSEPILNVSKRTRKQTQYIQWGKESLHQKTKKKRMNKNLNPTNNNLQPLMKKPFRCENQDCGKSFVLKTGLIIHIRTVHNKERLYTCEEKDCAKKFGQKYVLRLHIRTVHYKERPYFCVEEGCAKDFGHKYVLRLHIRTVHKGEKPYPCKRTGCEKIFGTKCNLGIHVRTVHEGERPFSCEELGCAKKFGLKSGLDCHTRSVHERKKPFSCNEQGCGKNFGHKNNLINHMRNVHSNV